DTVQIFDTTLRDGEQSPGFSMNVQEKLRMARQLEELGVDILEAGFPIASPGDLEGVRAVAGTIRGSKVAALARAKQVDVDAALRALEPAARPRLHVFLATSDLHLHYKLRMTRAQALAAILEMVSFGRQRCPEVEFSAEDASRTDIDYLCEVMAAAADAGATILNIPDTTGYSVPEEYGQIFRRVREHLGGRQGITLSAHCHNDLGMAVANSLAAVRAGALQVECTINGIGERAGNAALEEIVMAVRTRQDIFGCDTRIDTTQIVPASRLVSGITGFPVQPNKAIVGANAFAHEAGIHQDGVLKHRETYEIMRAEEVGWAANRMVLGKHSGRNAFRNRLVEIGIEVESEEALNTLFARFKELADKKHDIFDEDLHALVSEEATTHIQEHFKLVSLTAHSETGESPFAKIVIAAGGHEEHAEAQGSGPVDASFKAIESIVASGAELQLFSVNNITTGTESQGEVTV
ncbi:MAG: 2-isopropylmalate synthase, partial [Burkholderiales bacterium]